MKFFFMLIVLTIPYLLYGQKSFVFKPGLDISLITLGGSGLVFSQLYLGKKHQPISQDEFNLLSKDKLFFLDQPRKEFKIPATLSDIISIGNIAPAFYFLINKENRKSYGIYLTMYLETMLLNTSITDIIKYSSKRPRPYVYNFISYDEVLKSQSINETNLSFYSGHTSSIAATSFFMARTITLNETNTTKKTLVWIGAATIPAIQGGLRVAAGKHFTSDVISGYLMGAITGYLIPTLHIKKQAKH